MAPFYILLAAIVVYALCVVFYALWKGYDVKTALKVPFIIGFTFEANDRRSTRRRTEKSETAAGESRS